MKSYLIAALCTAVAASAVTAHEPPDYISSVYMKYLGRLPSPEKHAYWTVRLKYSAPIELEARLLAGDAYFESKAGRTSRGFIHAMYRDILNERDPHPAQVERWLDQLRTFECRELVAQMFLAEYVPAFSIRRTPVRSPGISPPPPTQPIRIIDQHQHGPAPFGTSPYGPRYR